MILKAITIRQSELLRTIKRLKKETRVSPTTRELALAFGVSSAGTLGRILLTLCKKGYLRKVTGKSRAFTVSVPESKWIIVTGRPDLVGMKKHPLAAAFGIQSGTRRRDHISSRRDLFAQLKLAIKREDKNEVFKIACTLLDREMMLQR